MHSRSVELKIIHFVIGQIWTVRELSTTVRVIISTVDISEDSGSIAQPTVQYSSCNLQQRFRKFRSTWVDLGELIFQVHARQSAAQPKSVPRALKYFQ